MGVGVLHPYEASAIGTARYCSPHGPPTPQEHGETRQWWTSWVSPGLLWPHPQLGDGTSHYRRVGVEVQALYRVSPLPGAGMWGWLITAQQGRNSPSLLVLLWYHPTHTVISQPGEGRSLGSFAGVLGGWLGRRGDSICSGVCLVSKSPITLGTPLCWFFG